MRYVIVGGSAAGAQAAETLRDLDPAAAIVLIGQEPYVPYSRCLLSRLVDGRLGAEGLYFKTRGFFAARRIEGLTGLRAERIDRASRTVVCSDGRTVAYDRLLLATGARPAFPKIPGADRPNVFAFHGLDDAKGIVAAAAAGEAAVVIGGGFAGLEAAYALARIGRKVTVVERCSQILPNQLDGPASRIIQTDLEACGVDVVLDESVRSIDGTDRATGVTLTDRTRMSCGLVVIATGTRPNRELASEAGLRTDRGVVVNDYLQTSDPDVFAAGDLIEVEDVSSGRRVCSATWFNAVLQGRFAASNMAGRKRRYGGAVGIQNAVQFHHVPAISFGLTHVEADEDAAYEVMSVARGNVYRKLVLKDDVLCGMIFVGDIAKSGFYAALIRHGVNVAAWKDRLFDPDFSYAALAREQDFGQASPYGTTSPAWDRPDFWTARAAEVGIA